MNERIETMKDQIKNYINYMNEHNQSMYYEANNDYTRIYIEVCGNTFRFDVNQEFLDQLENCNENDFGNIDYYTELI